MSSYFSTRLEIFLEDKFNYCKLIIVIRETQGSSVVEDVWFTWISWPISLCHFETLCVVKVS